MHNSLAEKVYLQLDNTVYTTDKTIWFKAILINAGTHQTAYSSGILYVDLIDSKQHIVNSKLIKINDGIGNGHFELDRSYEPGMYLIRSYTEWNKNFNSDFIFEKDIQIFSENKNDKYHKPIQNIRRVDSNAIAQRFKANLYPKLIDPDHKKSLMVFVTQDDQIDTLISKRGKEDSYVLDYEISNQSKRVELSFLTDNERSYSTSFSPQLDYIDLQFFPESGHLINGLSNRVGFKAVGADGRGVFVEGYVLNETNDIITSFKSNTLGMGSFKLEDVYSSARYKVQLKSDYNTSENIYYLPQVIQSGYLMNVISKKDKIYVAAKTNIKGDNSIVLKGMSRGFEYLKQEATLINGSFIYVFPKQLFPEGIIAFTLFDNTNRPVAERLFFNHDVSKRLMINSTFDQKNRYQRDKIDLSISTQMPDKIPVSANVSVLVLNKENLDSNHQNIQSYFLLSSDLKGPIENPKFYFQDGHIEDIDFLMLTQGWRRYKYHDPIRKLNYKLEKNLNVSGIVTPKNSKNKNNPIELMLMTFDTQRSVYTTDVVAPGSFEFQLNDIYGQEQEIVIQALDNTKTDKNDYHIALNKKTELPVDFVLNTISGVKDSLVQKIVEKNRAFKNKQEQYYFNTFGTTKLDEVVINGYRMTPLRKKMADNYGRPNAVIDGKDLREAESELSTGLFSVLFSSSFRDKIIVTRGVTGGLSAKTAKGGRGHITLFVVDGEPVTEVNMPLLQYLLVDEITSVEVIDNPRKLKKLYSIVMSAPPPHGRFEGSIISIYTRSAKGLFGAIRTSEEKLELNTIPVFSIEKEFYAPKHDSNHVHDLSVPDLRSTIFWEPQLLINDKGVQTLSYYHSDNVGTFQIIIEAISKTGEIGYQVLNYTVEERTN
ncbi:hypothetical protein [Psychroserpens luteolus]|uniref:hypothetical protein n=1 Tax=Psychroserpens luteolus TaxID=2855840 RepID=UPI001E4A4A48|nr:hypothetical protein [Psychroserpens luteolus]MCD2258595.1 hypothetical protein [Psychroserpens luteolus]